jgi:uncharacterized membrane protein YraQ (UPF0718 family)
MRAIVAPRKENLDNVAMAVAALIVDVIFAAVGLIPAEHHARVVEASISWNYATWLNIVFLAVAALLVWRFVRTGAAAMVRMMNKPPGAGHTHYAHWFSDTTGHCHLWVKEEGKDGAVSSPRP